MDRVSTRKDETIAVAPGGVRELAGVRCALDLTEKVRSHLQLSVRAGLHVGEIETRESDVTGLAVNLAARITDLATGGEVLVSRTIVDLVAGAGLDFDDRGSHSLKGLPGEHLLFSARR